MIISSTIVFELGSYLFSLITLDINMEIISFIKILFIETLYNVIITIIIYPLIQKLGHILEETFKTRNILTRYF